MLGGDNRAFEWRFTTDRSRTVVKRRAHVVDLEHDLLAFSTRESYLGGCTKVVRLSDPATQLWRSCYDRVWAVSPDGTRLATVDLLGVNGTRKSATVRCTLEACDNATDPVRAVSPRQPAAQS